jgi:hypothetical protein
MGSAGLAGLAGLDPNDMPYWQTSKEYSYVRSDQTGTKGF